LAFNNIQRDQFPAVDFELITITTSYPGASPEDDDLILSTAF
jgi:multidrug efflux pump subunit AcrB